MGCDSRKPTGHKKRWPALPDFFAEPFGMLGRGIEMIASLEKLVLSVRRGLGGTGEQMLGLGLRQRLEGSGGLEGLVQDLHAVAAGDHYRSRLAEREM